MNTTPSRMWQFDPFDSWFFRESRPFDSIGGAQLSSHFPPPARTLAGAIRTAIGEFSGVDWHRYNNVDDTTHKNLRDQLGDSQSFGNFLINGPYLLQNGERLYPAPLLLLEKEGQVVRLVPGEDEVACDLGRIRLPKLPQPLPGAAPLENTWLTRAGLEKVLSGGVPEPDEDVRRARALWSGEERLGIGRDTRRRTNIEGLLYQTRHIRLHEKISLGVQVGGIDEKFLPPRGMLRLGGEGRFSSFEVSPLPSAPLALPTFASNRLLLVLLTPADFFSADDTPSWKPPGFKQTEASQDENGGVWRWELDGVTLRLVSAIIGKTVREGGWDMANRQPRALRSLIPSGSCYFCEIEGDARSVAEQLHHRKLGRETELGRGEIAVGVWS